MTALLRERIGLGTHELISIVGAGGKSMILFALGRELAAAGNRVILTTTTMMAADQVSEPISWSDDAAIVDAALRQGEPLWVATGRLPGKVTGPSPEAVDRLFTETAADHVIVEADGARSKSIKAPAEHEPAIPDGSTTVIVVIGADAMGRPLRDVAHRPERVAAMAGLSSDDPLTVEAAAEVLLNPNGGLKGVPPNARVTITVTKVTPTNRRGAVDLSTLVNQHPRVANVVLLDRADL